MKYKYLSKVNSPSDLKSLSFSELDFLAEEIRDVLLETVYRNGGHLSSNLGAVELILAMHRCFSSPMDKFIFDVGHQCYTHKLLTGRFSAFSTLRSYGGISGFCSPDESEHDVFFSGHSGAALSSATGISAANKLNDDESFVVSLIGDGAFSCGMTYEALNNLAEIGGKHIIILNDNNMFISESVGSFSRLDDKKTFFEKLGYGYIGTVDGHNIEKLCNAFEKAKGADKSVVVHAYTVKGKGYDFVEKHPQTYHGISCSDSDSEDEEPSKSFSDEFGRLLCEFAQKDKSVCAVTAAMCVGTGLEEFSNRFPERFFDVGIAEQHAVGFSSGLAKRGMKPVFAVYSTFLQRAYDQLIHDIALQKQRVVFAVDRAGFVGEDGVTHQGLFDVAFLNSIPEIEVFSPCSFERLKSVMNYSLYDSKVSTFIRYPRASEKSLARKLSFNDGFAVSGDGDVALVTYGNLTDNGLKATESLRGKGIDVQLVSIEKIKPLPEKVIDILSSKKSIFFFEEGQKSCGIGEKTAALLLEKNYKGKYRIVAVGDKFVGHAECEQLFEKFSLDTRSMIKIISGEK